jgi:hypothetical protein
MVDVTDALEPSVKRQCLILPSDVINKIYTTASRLRRESVLDQLRNDFFEGEVKDWPVPVLDLLIGLIDQVEDRMGVYVGAKYLLQAADFQIRRIIRELNNDFDGGVIQYTDHAGDSGPRLMWVSD